MIGFSQVLRKQLRQSAAPAARAIHIHAHELKLHARPAKVETPLPEPDPRLPLQIEPGPQPELKPVQRSMNAPPIYRSGDGDKAIKVCLQDYAVIVLDAGNPPALRVLDRSAAPPEVCCKLPGVRSLDSDHALALEIGLNNTLPLHQVPPLLLETFWTQLPSSMTPEGQYMFAHFNDGLPAPTTAIDCYKRLQAYTKWLWNLAD